MLIPREVTPETIAAEIKLERGVHKGSFLLTEGAGDSRLFGQFVDRKACSLVVCFGREMVLAAIALLDAENFPGVLGIVDSDYDRFFGVNPTSQNVCVTDNNDAEMMMCAFGAFDKITAQYASPTKIAEVERTEGRRVLDALLDRAAFVGRLRYVNKKRGWSLKFSEMELRFSTTKGIDLDTTANIHALISRSKVALSPADIVEGLAIDGAFSDNLFEVCNGHDFCQIASRALRRHIGNDDQFHPTNGRMFQALSLAFEYQDFKRTRLYACVRAWEARNVPYLIFRL